MQALLIQIDGKFPNLALMKISAWLKLNGIKVYLKTPEKIGINQECKPDLVFISCIFTKNKNKALRLAELFSKKAKVWIGGSGINYNALTDEIEHLCPDYDLYKIDYSIGFTSRGCIRKCPFCIVPKKEGYIKEHSPFEEFVRHDKIVLLDNNFLASPKWREKLKWLIENEKKVNFNQGLDIRLINKENAKLLTQVKYYDWKFKNRRLHFAWDLEYDDAVFRGIETLDKAGIPRSHLMFYVLVGFNTDIERDLYRIEKLKEFGIKPFVMPYNGKKHPLTRWVNRRYYEFISSEDWLKRKKEINQIQVFEL